MKKKPRRYVIHEARKARYGYSVFDNSEKRDIKGGLSLNKAVELWRALRKKETFIKKSTEHPKKEK